jgi:pilus assembly protein TadC
MTNRSLTVGVLVGLSVGLAAGAVAGTVLGMGVGMCTGFAAALWHARRPSREQSARNRQVSADLPYAADLLAAALRAGSAPDTAARCVGDAVGGPLGERLGQVAAALRLGTPVTEAWRYLGGIPGATRIAEAAERTQHSGAAFAGALQRVATDLRTDLLIQADAAARRAGVLIVLPLGLCFLPAFVLTGLVPVVVAVLGDVLSP